jgi:hypothetical protein
VGVDGGAGDAESPGDIVYGEGVLAPAALRAGCDIRQFVAKCGGDASGDLLDRAIVEAGGLGHVLA